MDPSPPSRNPSLDGVRGVAILLVVAAHAGIPGARLGGNTGVTLFFVLSGYLITALLVAEREDSGRIALGAFYARRALRLLPALLVAVLGGVVITLAFDLQPVGQLAAASALALTYLMNVHYQLGVHEPGVFSYYWSLAMEEQLYLLWPPILLLALRGGGQGTPRRTVPQRRWRIVLVGLGLAIAASIASRLALASGPDGWTDHAETLPQTHAFTLLVGCAAAIVHRSERIRPSWPATAAALGTVVGLTAVLGLRGGISEPPDATSLLIRAVIPILVVVPCAVLVAGVVVSPRRSRLLTHPVLVHLGLVSYGWYLWHGALIALALEVTNTPASGSARSTAVRTAAVLVALGVAELSHRWVEQPFLRRKAALVRAPAGAVEDPGPRAAPATTAASP